MAKTFYKVDENEKEPYQGFVIGSDDAADPSSTASQFERWRSEKPGRFVIVSEEPPLETENMRLRWDPASGKIVRRTPSEIDGITQAAESKRQTVRSNVQALIASVKDKLVKGQPLSEDEADFLLHQKPKEWFSESR